MKLKPTYTIVFLLNVWFTMTLASDLNVEKSTQKWLNIESNQDRFHPTQLLDVIARYGHTLPDEKIIQLQNYGFNFSRELVTTDRPLNLDQFVDQGFFRFHYTLSGEDAVSYLDNDQNAIPDYIDSILVIFDNINSIDFDSLGYNRPPSDEWYTNQENGGSDHYDVYIFNLDPGFYGYVQAENYAQQDDIINRGDNEYSDFEENNAMVSFMALRNNYDGFPNDEINNVKVTSAHEFFHAIQYGYDGWEFGWAKEATATWMEELIYDEINDCYQYLEDFLESPELSFSYDTDRGYGSYIYFSYITDNWANNDFVRKFWENSIQYDSFIQDYSIDELLSTLNDYELDFEIITRNFLIANGLLSAEEIYSPNAYDEANDFPLNYPNLDEEIHLSGNDTTISISAGTGTFAAQYYLITIDSLLSWNESACCIDIELTTQYDPDTNIIAFLTSIEKRPFLSETDISVSPNLSIDPVGLDSLILVVSGFNYNYSIVSEYGDIEWGDIQYELSISTLELLNVSNQRTTIPNTFSLHQNYPNPFNGKTVIRYDLPSESDVEIAIYDLKGQLIKQLMNHSKTPGTHQVYWNGENSVGNNVSTGHYLYSIKQKNKIMTKKMIYVK
jgi:hypothetical protein